MAAKPLAAFLDFAPLEPGVDTRALDQVTENIAAFLGGKTLRRVA